jgi:hypothetical protein
MSVGDFEFKLGWASEQEDTSYLHEKCSPLRIFGAYTPPKAIDPRKWLSIRFQMMESSCAGHGLTAAARVDNYFATRGGVIDLSPQFSYRVGQMKCGIRGDQGCTISGVVQGAKDYGVLLEEDLPYTGDYNLEPTRENFDAAKDHLVRTHTALYSYNDVFNFLAAGLGAVVIGIPWQESLANHRQTKEPVESVEGQSLGGHCVALVGYVEDKDSDGNNYIILVNSHGDQWGDRGTTLVASSVFRTWCGSPQCELSGISDMEVYNAGRADFLNNPPTYQPYR